MQKWNFYERGFGTELTTWYLVIKTSAGPRGIKCPIWNVTLLQTMLPSSIFRAFGFTNFYSIKYLLNWFLKSHFSNLLRTSVTLIEDILKSFRTFVYTSCLMFHPILNRRKIFLNPRGNFNTHKELSPQGTVTELIAYSTYKFLLLCFF